MRLVLRTVSPGRGWAVRDHVITTRERDESPVWDVARSRRKGCKRWSTHPPSVLDLGVAEMDVSLSPEVTDAVRRAALAEAFG